MVFLLELSQLTTLYYIVKQMDYSSFFYYTLQAGITLLRDELRYGHLISAMSEIDCSSQQSAITENGSPVVFFAGIV